jgi:hypothetical protein
VGRAPELRGYDIGESGGDWKLLFSDPEKAELPASRKSKLSSLLWPIHCSIFGVDFLRLTGAGLAAGAMLMMF